MNRIQYNDNDKNNNNNQIMINSNSNNLSKWLWSCDDGNDNNNELGNDQIDKDNNNIDDYDQNCDYNSENQSIRSNKIPIIQATVPKISLPTPNKDKNSIKTTKPRSSFSSLSSSKPFDSLRRDAEIERLKDEIESLKSQLSKRIPMSSKKDNESKPKENSRLLSNNNNDTKISVETGNARLWKNIEDLKKENGELKEKIISMGTSLMKKDRELESIKARYTAIKKENERLTKIAEENNKIENEEPSTKQLSKPSSQQSVQTNVKKRKFSSASKQSDISPDSIIIMQQQRKPIQHIQKIANNNQMEPSSPPPPPPPLPKSVTNDSSESSSQIPNILNASGSSLGSVFSSISSIKDTQMPPRNPPSPPINHNKNNNHIEPHKKASQNVEQNAADRILALARVSSKPTSITQPSNPKSNSVPERKRKVSMVDGELMVNTDQGLIRLCDWVRSSSTTIASSSIDSTVAIL